MELVASNRTVQFYNPLTGRQVEGEIKDTGNIWAVAVAPNGRIVITAEDADRPDRQAPAAQRSPVR
jgi:hypothetical protein